MSVEIVHYHDVYDTYKSGISNTEIPLVLVV